MEIKTLAKNTVILASPKVLVFFVGIIKSKLIAVLLGTTGFGIVDQLTSMINLLRQSTLSFMPDGMVKLIAKERADKFDRKVIADIIKTFILMVIPIMILVLILAYLYSDELTIFILGDLKYKPYLLITLIALPITFIGASVGSLLKSFKEIKAIAMREIYVMLINFAIFVPLVYFYKVEGGVIHITLSFLVAMIVTIFMVRKNVIKKYGISVHSIKTALFQQKYFKELLTFVSVGIIIGIFKVTENMVARAIVVNDLGLDKIGTYAPIVKWQALFIGFILPSVYMYLYPRLSEAKTNKEINGVLNDVIRLITFLTLPFIIIGITTRQWIIPLFYSIDFIDAAIYLPYHFSFLLIAVWATIFEQLFAARNKLKIFLIFTIVIYSISLFLIYIYVPKYGLYGYLLRFTLTPLLLLSTYYIFWKREINFSLKTENFKIVLYSVLCMIILLFFKEYSNYTQFFIGLVLIAPMILLLKKQERNFLFKKITTILKIKK